MIKDFFGHLILFGLQNLNIHSKFQKINFGCIEGKDVQVNEEQGTLMRRRS